MYNTHLVCLFLHFTGQFNAAPTLLEKQQESIIARLKSLKEKQGLALGVGSGSSTVVCSRSRFSSFSEGVGIGEYSLRKGMLYTFLLHL